MKSVLIHEMTRKAMDEYLANEEHPVAFMAVGSVEQHGPHLPLGRDSIGAIDLARRAAEKCNAVVTMPTWLGYSPHHMGFAGTLTLSGPTFCRVLIETAVCLAHHGIKRIMLINNHGGNREIVAYSAKMAMLDCDAIVVAEPRKAYPVSASGRLLDLHSGKGETGRALVQHPELCDMQQVSGWQPTMNLAPGLMELLQLEGEDLELGLHIVHAHFPSTHEFTSSGIYGFASPEAADVEAASLDLENRIKRIVRYVELWRRVPHTPKGEVFRHRTS